jgi:murein DD-endopeptidase MepM/ murein hydrolase activator NlpD
MDIIILPRSSESRSYTYVGSRALGLGLLCILMLVLLAASGGYRLGIKMQPMTQEAQAERWQATLEKQQTALVAVTQQAKEGLNTLAHRVGSLQAEIVRLNALGQRLIAYADLEEGEFDFTNPPAIGGPETPLAEEALKVNDFLAAMEQLEQEITDRRQQLNLLETVLVERDLRQAALPAGSPLHQGWIASPYGSRTDPFNHRRGFHNGVDFAGRAGAEILAVAAGVITWVGERPGYGKMVEIDHGNGYITRYAHNQKNLAQVGESVAQGQVIALVGSTGRSTGPHVHLEVWHKGRTVDPLSLIRAAKNS